MEDRPIFIAGPDRSGTTLLYALLASHPNISMVRRMNFWRWFYGRYGDIKNPERFERLVDRLLNYKRMQRLNPDGERIRREFWQDEPTYGRLFSLLMRQNAERIGKSRWGEKSLHTERYADLVFENFPQARIIHMTRDPRDRYASVRKRFGGDHPRVAGATSRWLASMQAARRNLKKYPHSYLVVRFEDLASHPEGTARKICDFIGEEYVPEMLGMGGEAEYRDSGGNSSFTKIQPGTISTSPIGRFRQVLTPFEITFIQLFTKSFMREFDYPLEEVRLTAKQKVVFYGWFLPQHFLRMCVTYALSTLLSYRKERVPASRFIEGRAEVGFSPGGSHG